MGCIEARGTGGAPLERGGPLPRHLCVVASLLVVAATSACAWLECPWKHGTKHDYTHLALELVDTNGVVPRAVEDIEIGDSLSVGFSGLSPRAPVQVYLTDDLGREWSYARLFADAKGRIAPSLFWYHTGVIGTTSRAIRFRPDPAFETFEEAQRYFELHRLTLSVRDLRGRLLTQRGLPVRPRSGPLLYPSNAEGVLTNSRDLAREDVYVTGRNFPPGSTVHVYLVANQYAWKAGDPLRDVSGPEGVAQVEVVRLSPGQTGFTMQVMSRTHARPGAFDLVARIGVLGPPALHPADVLSYAEDTAVLLYLIINGNIVIESAGRTRGSPAKFEFSDSFEKQEDVWAAVDPTDVPAIHPGGNYAAYYVVEHQPESYWNSSNPALVDVSGGIEIKRVKYWCINVSRTVVWPSATIPEPIKGYDVVVDFGATPALDAASFATDGVYTKGTDFIDGYDKVGFWLFEDPSTAGPFAVGTVELDDPNGISGITDPTGTTGPTESVTLAWARIMYPAATAGTGVPVSSSQASYPVALFLHGRHWNCDDDGSGPGLTGGYSFSCPVTPVDQRIPSHEGYDYIMERLASQGIFSISISAHDIQPGLGVWDYDARGRLILKFLDKLRDWNANGTDPFGGIFAGKLDMTRIALSGHSRGGEGVVAAQELNATWPTPHSIVAVNAIAPTDQNSISYLMESAHYYLLVGARDGDVSNMQGFRTYDRSFPDGAPSRRSKTVAWVYGANHNYFNTIWTDTAALGAANPWAGSVDDGSWVVTPQVMPASEQRQIALTTITAFFRQHLQGIAAYKEISTGRLRPAAMTNQHVYWTYQDGERMAVDNFEQQPANAGQNTLGGAVTGSGFTTFQERLLNHDSSDYPGAVPADFQFYHDTLGMKLAWSAPQTYSTILPGGLDVTTFSHLTFRVAKRVPSSGPGSPLNLLVNVEDGAGKTLSWPLRTDQFDPIPHPYERSGGPQALLTGVRIPLRNFTMNNSGIDLSDLVKVTIQTEGAGEIGLDDVEFGK